MSTLSVSNPQSPISNLQSLSIWGRFPRLTPLILAIRNMRIRWMRTALTCLGIVLGVAVILAISITNDSTLKSIRNVFDEASGKANLLVQSSAPDSGGFEQTVVGRLSSIEGVVAAAPSAQATTLLARDAEDWQTSLSLGGRAVGKSLTIFGVEADVDPQVRQYEIIDGRWIKGDSYEAVIPEKYATEKELKVGNDLVIISPAGTERIRIVGIITNNGAGLLNDGAIAFVPLQAAQDMFDRGKDIDAIDIVMMKDIANDPNKLSAAKDRVAARLGTKYEVSYPASRGSLVTQMLYTYQQGLSFFSVVAIFVGAFLIYNAFSMTVLERTRELGLLRTLGMTKMQTLTLVMAEAVILCIIGSIIGVGFGVLLARVLIILLGGVVSTTINTLSIPLDGLVNSLFVGGAVTIGSALLPAIQASQVSPLESLRVQAKRPNPRSQRRLFFFGVTLTIASGFHLLHSVAAIHCVQHRQSLHINILARRRADHSGCCGERGKNCATTRYKNFWQRRHVGFGQRATFTGAHIAHGCFTYDWTLNGHRQQFSGRRFHRRHYFVGRDRARRRPIRARADPHARIV